MLKFDELFLTIFILQKVILTAKIVCEQKSTKIQQKPTHRPERKLYLRNSL